jgi:hypothetical protein
MGRTLQRGQIDGVLLGNNPAHQLDFAVQHVHREIDRSVIKTGCSRRALSDQCCELERKILATPTFTAEGLTGKRRVVERAELDSWDDLGIIETIFALDAERVAAAG